MEGLILLNLQSTNRKEQDRKGKEGTGRDRKGTDCSGMVWKGRDRNGEERTGFLKSIKNCDEKVIEEIIKVKEKEKTSKSEIKKILKDYFQFVESFDGFLELLELYYANKDDEVEGELMLEAIVDVYIDLKEKNGLNPSPIAKSSLTVKESFCLIRGK